MPVKELKIKVPDELVRLIGSDEMAEKEAKESFVLDLVRKQKISQGKGAELLGISLWDFQELLAEYDKPMVDLSPEELEEGLRKQT